MPAEEDRATGDPPAAPIADGPASPEGVTLYSRPGCPFSQQVRDYLNARQVAFTEHDVTRNEAALRRMLWLTGTPTVPVTVVNRAVLVGFDEERLNEMFDGPLETIEELTAPPDPEDVDIW